MRVLLFFPPQCRPLHAQLGLPMIKAELKRRGHTCRVVDLNLRFYEHVLSAATLADVKARIQSEVATLEHEDRLSGSQVVRYVRMTSALVRADYVIAHVERAVAVLRTREFYDIGKFQWARKIIEEALDLYGSAYGHTDIGLSQLRTRFSTSDPAALSRAIGDRQENPFIDLLLGWAKEAVGDFEPDVIGISIGLDEQLIPALTLASQLRQSWRGKLVAGGTMVTRLERDLPHHPVTAQLFDSWFSYESEVEFGDEIDGMAGRTPSPRVPFTELVPDFSDLPLDRYLLPEVVLPFLGSRGCSYGRCHYCNHYKTYERYAFGDPKAAARIMGVLSERYGCRHFYLVDEALEPKYGVQLAKALDHVGVDVRWMVFGRMHDKWTPEVVDAISRAGCRRLIFGLDNASERVLSIMNKKTDLEHAESILAACSDSGISVQINMIVGYPGETRREAEASFAFVESNSEQLRTLGSTVAYANFVLVRGAAWEEMPIRPIVDPRKRFALQFGFESDEGLGMHETPTLAYAYQRRADELLRSSWRYPTLREFAFLYRDRFGAEGRAPRTTEAPMPRPRTHWFRFDVCRMFEALEQATAKLPVRPQEYVSRWWLLASESDLHTTCDQGMHGVQLGAGFTGNSFELPLVRVFQWSAEECSTGDLLDTSMQPPAVVVTEASKAT